MLVAVHSHCHTPSDDHSDGSMPFSILLIHITLSIMVTIAAMNNKHVTKTSAFDIGLRPPLHEPLAFR
eukprot:CAMPEP_0197061800 /NCGR_PEP_ID=MMETSP1384-20130603/139582_1 /TAXON_ID=29189 /ORGANISM="Ammonia sp." /LENGTH=67 /DNA_ID=CAMNT_0042497545 /DNA_START=48 /DNA_END=251 /DNA_ORIENTATION=-